jgi:drug/metabolite transporter (DMT)-like permease
MLTTRSRCVLFAVLSSVLSSVGTLFKVQGVRDLHPVLVAAVGLLVAGSITLLYLAATRQLPSRTNLKAVSIPLLKLTFYRSILGNLLFTIGLTMSTGVEVVFLTKMEPYLVIFWVWLLDSKRPSTNHLLLLLIHIIGAVLLAAGGKSLTTGVSWWGDLLVVGGVVTAALSYRYAPLVTSHLSPLQTASLAELIGGVLILPFALLLCSFDFGAREQTAWCYIGVHTVLFYVFAIPFLYASLKGLEGWLSSALRAVGPLVAAPIALVFFGETLTPVQVVGAVVVLVTSALISKQERK